LQPRAKSRVFEVVDISYHPLPVTFHLFLPQICHNDFAHASARLSGNDAEYIVVARHGRPVKVDQISVQGLLMNEATASGQGTIIPYNHVFLITSSICGRIVADAKRFDRR